VTALPWSNLAAQFSLELGFGVLVAMSFVPVAPVGRFFYRLMGTTAALPILAAALMPILDGEAGRSDAPELAAFAALVGYPAFAGPHREGRATAWWLGLAWSLAWTAAALFLVVAQSTSAAGPLEVLLAGTSALATGVVAGSVGLAMVLGHWYLTVPKLEVSYLARLNRVTVVAMLASLVLLAASCLVFRQVLAAGERPLLGPWGLFYLGTRVVAGLALPLLFAWMTAGSLRFSNTRSATGILYASTILVLIGTAVSISLQESYGVPL
jgi:hypothetical protein